MKVKTYRTFSCPKCGSKDIIVKENATSIVLYCNNCKRLLKAYNKKPPADLIDRKVLMNIIKGDQRPVMYDGAQEVDWIMECIEKAPVVKR